MPVPDPFLKKFGANVRAKREAQNLSQEALAERARLDRTYIGGVERGERNLSIKSAIRVAKALGITVAKLCEGIDG
jgi:transcriptional regulator with XRE-family HTH domain